MRSPARVWRGAMLILGVLIFQGAHTEENSQLHAQLSWSALSSQQGDLPSSSGTNTLFLHFTSGVTSFRGATMELRWNPVGDVESACLTPGQVSFPSSQGSTCRYLNRGTSLPVETVRDPGHLIISWANSISLTTCTAGVVAAIPFDFTGCLDQPAKFELCALTVLSDSFLETIVPEARLGSVATFRGGGTYYEPCHVPADSCTPQIGYLSNFFVPAGQTLGITPWLTDTTCVVSWTAENAPPGHVFDPGTGTNPHPLLWWQAGIEGEHYDGVRIIATTAAHHADTVSFSIHVTPSDNRHFGIFQAAAQQDDGGRITAAGAEWLHRTLFPLMDVDGIPATIQAADEMVTMAQEKGLDIVFDLSTAVDASLMAQWPPADTFTVQDWVTRVTALAARYCTGSDSLVRMPGLGASVDWWHIEEEASFWPPTDLTGCSYAEEYKYTRSALLSGNYAAKTILIGLSSDPATAAAYFERLGSVLPALANDHAADTTSAGFSTFRTRTRNWIGRFPAGPCPLPWYDAIDVHSFERDDVLRGKVHWIRSMMDGPPRQIWVNEAGGPAWDSTFHSATWDPPYAPAYHDSLNAGHVFRQYAEALANGVQRYAWQFYPPGPESPFFAPPGTMNQYSLVPLFRNPLPGADPPPYVAKQSNAAYMTLTDLLRSYKMAADRRIQDDALLKTWICPPESLAAGKCRTDCCPDKCVNGTCSSYCTDHDSSCVATPRFYPNSDVTCVLNMEFWPSDSTGFTQANVLWAGSWPTGRADSVTIRFAVPGTDSIWMTRIPTTTESASEPTVQVVTDSLTLLLGPSPVIIAMKRRFSAYQTTWQGVPVPVAPMRPQYGLRVLRRDARSFEWSLTRPRDHVFIGIFDVAGRQVQRIPLGPVHTLQGVLAWDGRDSQGRNAANGLYRACLVSGSERLADTPILLVR